MLPLIKPATFSVALIVFINAWNEYLYALTFMTNDNMRTVPVGIALFPSNYELPWGDIAAATVVVTVPLIILVLIFQKKDHRRSDHRRCKRIIVAVRVLNSYK